MFAVNKIRTLSHFHLHLINQLSRCICVIKTILKKNTQYKILKVSCVYIFAAHDAYKCAWGSCELTDAYIFVYKPSFISVKQNNMLTQSACKEECALRLYFFSVNSYASIKYVVPVSLKLQFV